MLFCIFPSTFIDIFKNPAPTSQALLVLQVLLGLRDLQAFQGLRSLRRFFSRSSKR